MRQAKPLPADILSRIDSLSIVLSEHKDVAFAYLFGSLVLDKVGPLSDVDIAVYLMSTQDVAETKLDLIGVISSTLQTDEFDLVILNQASVSLVGRILRQRRILVDKNPPCRHQFESLMNRQFFDFSVKEAALLEQRFS